MTSSVSKGSSCVCMCRFSRSLRSKRPQSRRRSLNVKSRLALTGCCKERIPVSSAWMYVCMKYVCARPLWKRVRYRVHGGGCSLELEGVPLSGPENALWVIRRCAKQPKVQCRLLDRQAGWRLEICIYASWPWMLELLVLTCNDWYQWPNPLCTYFFKLTLHACSCSHMFVANEKSLSMVVHDWSTPIWSCIIKSYLYNYKQICGSSLVTNSTCFHDLQDPDTIQVVGKDHIINIKE